MHPRILHTDSRRRTITAIAQLVVALWLPRSATALTELYTIDPALSFVSIVEGSGATLDFGGGPIALPFRTQVGEVAGVSGEVLPGIGISNGLTTSLYGQIQTDYRPNLDIRFFAGSTYVLPGESGNWAPGQPGDPAGPSLAQGGVSFGGPLNIVGAAALRNAAFQFSTPPQPLTNLGGGAFRFNSFTAISVIDGAFDYDTNLFGLDGRGYLDEATAFAALRTGRIEELGGGLNRLTLPFDIIVEVDGGTLGGLPLDLRFVLEGQIVATNRIVPEPASAVLLASGLAAIATVTQRRRARREGVEHV